MFPKKGNDLLLEIRDVAHFELHVRAPSIAIIIEVIDGAALECGLNPFKDSAIVGAYLDLELWSDFDATLERFVLGYTDAETSFTVNKSGNILRIKFAWFVPSPPKL